MPKITDKQFCNLVKTENKALKELNKQLLEENAELKKQLEEMDLDAALDMLNNKFGDVALSIYRSVYKVFTIDVYAGHDEIIHIRIQKGTWKEAIKAFRKKLGEMK